MVPLCCSCEFAVPLERLGSRHSLVTCLKNPLVPSAAFGQCSLLVARGSGGLRRGEAFTFLRSSAGSGRLHAFQMRVGFHGGAVQVVKGEERVDVVDTPALLQAFLVAARQ